MIRILPTSTSVLLLLGITAAGYCAVENRNVESQDSENRTAKDQEAKTSAHTELNHALREAWDLRDQCDFHSTSPSTLSVDAILSSLAADVAPWHPLEYAPHLWRQLNALLIDFDARAQGGSAFDKQQLALQVKGYAAGLQHLKERALQPNDPLLIREIVEASQAFHQAGNLLQLNTAMHTPQLNELGIYVRFFNRLTYRTIDYLHWHGQSIFVDGANETEAPLALLLDRLVSFQELLELLNDQPFDPSSTAMQQLRERVQLMSESQMALEGILARQVEHAVKGTLEDKTQLVGGRLLLSPLLSRSQRERLHDSLVARKASSINSVHKYTYMGLVPPSALSQSHLSRLVQIARLHQRLFVLLDPDSVTAMEIPLRQSESALAAGTPDHTYSALRDLGGRLREVYVTLPARILQASSSTLNQGAVTQGRSAEGDVTARKKPIDPMLRLVDARDASEVSRLLGANRWIFPELRVRVQHTDATLDIVREPADDIRLSQRVWRPVRLRLQTEQNISEVSVRVDYPQERMQLRWLGTETPIAAGEVAPPIALAPDRQILLEGLALQPHLDPSHPAATERVTIQIQAGDLRASVHVPFVLPQPSMVAVRATQLVPPTDVGQLHGHGLRLRPFPNRQTPFQLSVTNPSDDDKEIQVSLQAVERPSQATFGTGRIFDSRSDVFPGIRLRPEPLASTKPFVLKAGETKNIPFYTPEDSEKTPPAASTPVNASASTARGDRLTPSTEAGTSATGQPISDGMACVVQNLQDASERWITWCEVKPLIPSEYLQSESQYERDQGQITVRVEPRDIDGDGSPDPKQVLPGGLSEKRIDVSWERMGALAGAANGLFFDQMDGRSRGIVLWARLSASTDDQSVTIPLTVDGSPRAFVHKLRVSRDNRGVDQRPDRRSVRISSLTMGKRVYRTSRSDVPSDPVEGQTVFFLEDTKRAYFAASRDSAPIYLQLQADAPVDAFSHDHDEDYLEVGWLGTSLHRMHADRQILLGLVGADGDGKVTLDARVSDLTAMLETRGKEGEFVVTSGGRVRGEEYLRHEVTVILDGQAPRIVSLRPRRSRLTIGQPVQFDLEVEDHAGLAQVKLGLTKGRDDKLPQDASPQKVADNTLSLSIPTIGLTPQTYWVQVELEDRVGHSIKTGDVGFDPFSVQLVAPVVSATKTKGEREKYIGTLSGRVEFGSLGFKPNGITLRIKGTKLQATSENGGTFRIPGIEARADEYVLEAVGPVQGTVKRGELKLKLASPEDFHKEAVIAIE